jgi:hypothetical protein
MGLLASRAFAASPLMTLLDTNKDGTVEVDEIEATAAATFERFISGSRGAALLVKGSRERLRSEFIALVTGWFAIADINRDGHLDEDELASPAGQKLGRMLTKLGATNRQPASQP